ncbi:hypothetical protein PHSC3_001832 [Chlamydiales bacterium STE3]|nr:hypothetical protein PHSC3_001832 [Chlamydiales bacterium STE3]
MEKNKHLKKNWSNFFKKWVDPLNAFAIECITAFRFVLPAGFQWAWRKYYSGEIETVRICLEGQKSKRFAYLYIHESPYKQRFTEMAAVLFVPGEHAKPYSLLHLMDLAKAKHVPVFSLYIPGMANNKLFSTHSLFLKQAITTIFKYYQSQNKILKGVLGIGHSKGAILLTHRQFIVNDLNILATCSIAGRLNAPTQDSCLNTELRYLVKKIYKSIQQKKHLPLMQIVPRQDWNASQESMKARPNERCYSVPGMHLSGLYKKETCQYVAAFVEEFATAQ